MQSPIMDSCTCIMGRIPTGSPRATSRGRSRSVLAGIPYGASQLPRRDGQERLEEVLCLLGGQQMKLNLKVETAEIERVIAGMTGMAGRP